MTSVKTNSSRIAALLAAVLVAACITAGSMPAAATAGGRDSSITQVKPTELQVMTFNLRYASDTPPNSWPERRPVMKRLLRQERPLGWSPPTVVGGGGLEQPNYLVDRPHADGPEMAATAVRTAVVFGVTDASGVRITPVCEVRPGHVPHCKLRCMSAIRTQVYLTVEQRERIDSWPPATG